MKKTFVLKKEDESVKVINDDGGGVGKRQLSKALDLSARPVMRYRLSSPHILILSQPKKSKSDKMKRETRTMEK